MLTIISIIGLLIFLCFHRTPIWVKPKIKARVTSRLLDRLPRFGVLAEGLIAYPIAYQSNQRIAVIPHDPDPELAKQRVDLSMKEFDLRYAVISEAWKTEAHLGYPAIKYIQDTFKLIKIICEDGDRYFIYEIPANFAS